MSDLICDVISRRVCSCNARIRNQHVHANIVIENLKGRKYENEIIFLHKPLFKS